MQNQRTLVGITAQKSSKSRLLFRQHCILAMLLLVAVLSGCSQKETKSDVTEFISGTDTIIVNGNCNIDLSKCHSSSGHNDTIAGIFRIKFENSFKKDTVFVHDTIYKKLVKKSPYNISSVNQTGGVMAVEVINNY